MSEQHLLHKVEIQQSKSKLGKDEDIPRSTLPPRTVMRLGVNRQDGEVENKKI